MQPGGWWFGGDCNVGGREKARKIGRLCITVCSLLQTLFTASWVAALRATNSMGWLVWPVLIELASSSNWHLQAAVARHEPGASSGLCLHFSAVNRAICQWSMLGGSVGGAGNCSGLLMPLGLLSPSHSSSRENNLINSEIGVAPSILMGRSLKWSCLGVDSSWWFIRPPGGAPQSRRSYPNTQDEYTALWWKTGFIRRKAADLGRPNHLTLVRSISLLLITSHKRNQQSCFLFCALSLSPGMAVILSNPAPAGLCYPHFTDGENDTERLRNLSKVTQH